MGVPIRIALMLRTLDEKGGIGVYSQHLTADLLNRDEHNHYGLLYNRSGSVSRDQDLTTGQTLAEVGQEEAVPVIDIVCYLGQHVPKALAG